MSACVSLEQRKRALLEEEKPEPGYGPGSMRSPPPLIF